MRLELMRKRRVRAVRADPAGPGAGRPRVGHGFVIVGSERILDLAAASSKGSAFSETSFTKGPGGSGTLFCQLDIDCESAVARVWTYVKETHLRHSFPSPEFYRLKVVATIYAAMVSSSAPP